MKYMRAFYPRRMARDLREEKIGKKEFYLYSLIFLVGIVLAMLFACGTWDGATVYNPDFLRIVDKFLVIVVGFGTILLAYYINKNGDGKRFWYRYISLELPITLVLGIAGLLILGLASIFGFITIGFFGYPDLIISIALYSLSVFITMRYMKFIASK